jgi:hypothetical protein
MEENQDGLSERGRLYVRLLKEAVEIAGVPDISEYKGEPLENRWHIFKVENSGAVILRLLVNTISGTLHADFYLFKAAVWIYDEAERVLNHPDAAKIFEIENDEERKEATYENARDCLVKYIKYLPIKIYQSLEKALDESIKNYIKQEIEPDYRENWESLGLSSDFLYPSKEYKEHAKQVEGWRKVLIGEKKLPLKKMDREILRSQYDELLVQYNSAREYHDTSRKVFFKTRRIAKDSEWREKWSTMGVDMFPRLKPECLQLLADLNYQPFELATQHLALVYDSGATYMRKFLTGTPSRSKQRAE